ncbi:9558_t:CDS:1 [Racocetra fulgida]|uniref:9558_t:CDS:1 n=1 Tax=Racocetra fulgida TaxID=60492 RepID=A0A9N8WDD9_9GLOM|nr:9558_t:CDS:1 [Racocetra fulgida]
MSSTHLTSEKLITTGTIESELHYGLYICDWWLFSEEKNILYSIPIRLGLEVLIQLNKKLFVVHVVCNIHSPLQPGYIYEESGQSSSIVTSTSAAIISFYQTIFSIKAKFAEPAYLGLNQIKTAQKLLEGIIFCPFIVNIENLLIFVCSLGEFTHSNQKKISHYSTTFFHKYKSKQSAFFQCFNKDSYLITIYQDSQIVTEYKNNSPNAVWQQIGVLKSIPGETLFAINNLTILYKLEEYKTKLQKPIVKEYTYINWIIKQL